MSERISTKDFNELRKGNFKRTRRAKANRNHHPRKAANVERLICDGLAQAYEGPSFNSPVNILVVHHRVRLCDPRGVSEKAGIDGIVAIGILRGDSLKEIKEIREEQYKVNFEAEEETKFVMRVVQPEGRLI